MSQAVKVAIIGAGSAQFSLNLVKDLCLTEGLAGSHISLMDIDADRLELSYKLGTQFAEQLGVSVSFDKTTDRAVALKDSDFVINTAFVLGHDVEAHMRHWAFEQYGYEYLGDCFGSYHQLCLILSVAQDMQRICPNAWLIQLGNPVFEGCTLIARETDLKVCGLCHGYQGYREIASTIDIDPDQATWQAPGINHNIWLTHFCYQGKNAYPLIDEWIATKGEDYWQTHVASRSHDIQMSRSAAHQYHMLGLFPVGDTVRYGSSRYRSNLQTKKYWFGEPWGGPDTLAARAEFVAGLKEYTQTLREWIANSHADLVSLIGTAKTQHQTVPIMDALVNDHEGCFQVNVPNRGALHDVPDDVVVEVPAIVNQKGIQPLCVGALPPKIMFERILPDWLRMERLLLAFQTKDKSALLQGIWNYQQTRSYEQAIAVLDELMQMDEVMETEKRQNMIPISSYFQHTPHL
jgi:alpha-galactosidase